MTRGSRNSNLVAALVASVAAILGGDRPPPEAATNSAALTFPRVVKKVAPFYPERAILNGLAGIVLLEVPIDKAGQLGRPKVLQSSGSDLLDVSAVCCLAQWRFKPARRNGKPTDSVWRQEIEFKLPPAAKVAEMRRTAREDAPHPASMLYPGFPKASIQRGEEGSCEMEVTWTTNGYPSRIKLLRSTGHPDLDLVALGTVYTRWRLDTTRGPIRDPTVTIVPIEFRIDDYWDILR